MIRLNNLNKRRTIFPAAIIAGACVLLIAGFCLPWFSLPAFDSFGDGPLNQNLPTFVSGLNMLLGGRTYAIAYTPYLVPEIFSLLWLLPICALLVAGLAVAERAGWVWRQPRPRGVGLAKWALFIRLFGIWITLAGFLLLLLSIFLPGAAETQKISLSKDEENGPAQRTAMLSRRRTLAGLLGLVAANTLGTGGYLLQRLRDGRQTLVSFPLLTSFQQQPRQVRENLVSALREGRVAWSSDGKRVFTFAETFYAESRDAFSGTHLLRYPLLAQDVAISPDSTYLALLDPTRGTPAIVTAWDGTLVSASWTQEILETETGACLAWSPDGKRLAIGAALQKPNAPAEIRGAGILCYDAFSRQNQRVYEIDQPGNLWTVAWSPDGRYLAGAGLMLPPGGGLATGYALVWEVASGRVIFSTLANYWASLAWAPDSRHLALAYGNTVEVWLPTEARKVLVYSEHPAEVWSLAWSPDIQHIASASEDDGLVHVWEISTGQLRYLYQGHSWTVTDMSWSSDGTYLLTCAWRNNAVHIWKPQI
jgi:hypothetical protein